MLHREDLSRTRRWVVKIGSSLVTNDGRGLDHAAINRWATQIAALRAQGIQVALVSSGAVAEGLARLNWDARPQELHGLQAAAAVGQMGLVQAYETAFKQHQLHTAQVLLSNDDRANRSRYLNAHSTLCTLLGLGVIPVINENDAVATEEIRLGDNDTLGSLVVNLIEADVLVILTDQDGLFDADPRQNPNAKLIHEGRADNADFLTMAGGGAGTLGRGGMRTKILAAQKAAAAGAATIIASGREDNVLLRLAQGECLGTLLTTDKPALSARKQWIVSQIPAGQLHLDAGAVRVLVEQGRSLLPVGVTRVVGAFSRGDTVACIAPDGAEIARGIVNYSAAEAVKIAGQPSTQIGEILGVIGDEEIIHRSNLCLNSNV